VLLLLSTYRKYPKSEEWTAVGHSIVAWLSRHDRAFDCETLYRLVAMLIAGGPKGVVQALTTCVQGDAFWQRGRLSSVALIPSLPIVAALALQGKVQHNGFVSDEVKEFWKIDGDQDQLNRVYFQFLQLKIQRVFWALATDNRNKLAIGVIRKFKLKELYSSGWGVHYIDEYDWLAGEELLEVARLLVENGSFVSNKDNMQGKLDDYFKVYSILMRLNLAEVDEFVGAEVDSVSEDNWYKYLSENVLIFGLIKGKNHRFSEAFGRHLDKILSGECALDARYRNSGLIRELLSKVVDASTILFPRIVKKYFGAEDDRLKDADFDALKDFISPYVREVSPADYVPRLNKWLDACDYKKIDWFLEQEIVKSEMPSEGLLSRVKGGMSADNSELKNIVKRLNDKLQLGVVAVDFESNSP
ncbi:MAG TPA: hypothetical protein PK129_12775, partial [Cellvibrionaceae bacterium]|nr:hypothetical protein [Cellvibrionaceae bacterium]